MTHFDFDGTTVSRRNALLGTAAALATVTGLVPIGLLGAGRARAEKALAEVAVDELMKPAELPELILGNPDAKVTIVEYASMTCGACGYFHAKVLPDIKKKYIDTGKARLLLRPFARDNLDAAGWMLSFCAGGDKSLPLASILFDRQESWVVRDGATAIAKLFDIAKQAGFTQEAFDKCLSDQKLLDKVAAVQSRASDRFKVGSTPTFYINGKLLDMSGKRLRTPADMVALFDAAIEPLLKNT